MEQYTATRPVTLQFGVLGLTAQQAAARAHNLDKLNDGRFRIVAPVQFKAGESFEYDGDLPKSLAARIGTDSPPAAAKAKAHSAETGSKREAPLIERAVQAADEARVKAGSKGE
ncbi:hypothetical protein ABO04_05020 [Nitrosomonas sp. HPC101]|nr:hypothetical protein [Nitrosomonas sp. HPC101]